MLLSLHMQSSLVSLHILVAGDRPQPESDFPDDFANELRLWL